MICSPSFAIARLLRQWRPVEQVIRSSKPGPRHFRTLSVLARLSRSAWQSQNGGEFLIDWTVVLPHQAGRLHRYSTLKIGETRNGKMQTCCSGIWTRVREEGALLQPHLLIDRRFTIRVCDGDDLSVDQHELAGATARPRCAVPLCPEGLGVAKHEGLRPPCRGRGVYQVAGAEENKGSGWAG